MIPAHRSSANSCCTTQCAVLAEPTSVVFAQQKPRNGSTTPRRHLLNTPERPKKSACPPAESGLELHTLMLPKAPADQLTNQVKTVDKTDCAKATGGWSVQHERPTPGQYSSSIRES